MKVELIRHQVPEPPPDGVVLTLSKEEAKYIHWLAALGADHRDLAANTRLKNKLSAFKDVTFTTEVFYDN